jgi:hypothetical protein
MKPIKFFLFASLAIAVVSVLYVIGVRSVVVDNWSNYGVFGDTFGGLTAFFTALAFAGVVYSLVQQNSIVKRQEEEIERDRQLLIQQNNTIALQRFEGSFFNMLAIFNAMKSSIYNENQFAVFHNNNIGRHNCKIRQAGTLQELRDAYNNEFDNQPALISSAKSVFGQYIASFEGIVEQIIDESPQKDRHLKFFFSQLTNLEKIVLLYHFNLGSTTKHFESIRNSLFRSLRDSPNEVYTPHFRFLKGMEDQ